jgi:hypothetical protein
MGAFQCLSPLLVISVLVSTLDFESVESVPEFRGAVGCCGEITGIGCGAEVVELGVDPTDIGTVIPPSTQLTTRSGLSTDPTDIGTVTPSSTQLTTRSAVRGICDPVPYPPKSGDITFDRSRIVGSYVDHNLVDTEIKAGEVDLGRGSIL